MTPPSAEHLAHEMDQWLTGTPAGRILAETRAIEGLADTIAAHFPDTDPRLLGEVLLRLASCCAAEPEMPTWMVVNLTGAAGARLLGQAATGGGAR